MRVTRSGRRRDHGTYAICSTKTEYDSRIINRRVKDESGEEHLHKMIQVDLDLDHERSGGGEHWHFVQIDMRDFARLVSVVSQAIEKDTQLRDELAEQFDGNITALERLKFAIMGLL